MLGNFLEGKISFCIDFLIFSENFPDFELNIFCRAVKIVFQVSRWTFWKQNFKFFGLGEKTFGFEQNFFDRFVKTSKLHSTWPNELFCDKNWNNQIFFGFWAKKIWQCCQNCVLRVRILFFGGGGEKFWYEFENLFSTLNGQKADFELKSFGRVVEIAFYVIRRIFWEKHNSEKLFISYFGLRAKKFWTFSQNSSAFLSKLYSTCPGKHLGSKNVNMFTLICQITEKKSTYWGNDFPFVNWRKVITRHPATSGLFWTLQLY